MAFSRESLHLGLYTSAPPAHLSRCRVTLCPWRRIFVGISSGARHLFLTVLSVVRTCRLTAPEKTMGRAVQQALLSHACHQRCELPYLV